MKGFRIRSVADEFLTCGDTVQLIDWFSHYILCYSYLSSAILLCYYINIVSSIYCVESADHLNLLLSKLLFSFILELSAMFKMWNRLGSYSQFLNWLVVNLYRNFVKPLNFQVSQLNHRIRRYKVTQNYETFILPGWQFEVIFTRMLYT